MDSLGAERVASKFLRVNADGEDWEVHAHCGATDGRR